MATVKIECIGEEIPPPLLVDCSRLRLEKPYGAITLRDLLPLLPQDGLTRFHRSYDLDTTEAPGPGINTQLLDRADTFWRMHLMLTNLRTTV